MVRNTLMSGVICVSWDPLLRHVRRCTHTSIAGLHTGQHRRHTRCGELYLHTGCAEPRLRTGQHRRRKGCRALAAHGAASAAHTLQISLAAHWLRRAFSVQGCGVLWLHTGSGEPWRHRAAHGLRKALAAHEAASTIHGLRRALLHTLLRVTIYN